MNACIFDGLWDEGNQHRSNNQFWRHAADIIGYMSIKNLLAFVPKGAVDKFNFVSYNALAHASAGPKVTQFLLHQASLG